METLTSRIARRGALTPLDAVGWIVRLARSLERGHARGLIHKRVSPHCLLIEDSDPASAGRLVEPQEAPDLIAYHSPERVAGKEPAPSDDAWGVAVTLYEALTGMAAYEGADDAAALAHLQDARPVPLVAFGVDDADLQAILDRALTQEWMERTNNLSALRRALEAWRPAARLGGLAPLDDPRLPAAARGSATIPPGALRDFRSVAPPPPSTSEPEQHAPKSRPPVGEREERALLPLVEAPAPEPDVEEDTRIFMADRFPLLAAVERTPPEPEPARAAEPEAAREPEAAQEPEPAPEPEAAREPEPAPEPEPESAPEKPAIAALPPARAKGGSRTMMMLTGAVVIGGIAAVAALRREPPRLDVTPTATATVAITTPPPPASSPAPITTTTATPTATATATATATPTATATATATATTTATATATATVSAPPVVDLKACVRRAYPPDTFTAGSMPDFAYLCEETDPRRGATKTKTKLVVGSGGRLSDAMREWALMDWYQMASFAVLRARCCSAPRPLELPKTPGPCPQMDQRLNELGAAAATATDLKDAKLKAAVEGYTEAIHCLVRTGSTGSFEWHDNPHGGEDTAFLTALGRVVAAKR